MKSVIISRLNKRSIILVVAFIALYVCAGCIDTGPPPGKKLGTFREDGRLKFVDDDDTLCASIAIEIADTLQTRAKGLMGRREMDDTVGMLFIYDSADDRVFWMRNTPLSLDIIFVSENRQVINIAKRTQPLSDNQYRSQGPAKYVVEVMSGFSDRHEIGEGTRVRWQRNWTVTTA